ncbi:hypothetical protein [Jeotgalicoccus sp. FSL K6-3177]|uniref:hypothetical protein n=1 Tax=Jeotgalicoccus sp. FSL K6-3177 TaxID=2921494 RepID=UPI0030FDBBA0
MDNVSRFIAEIQANIRNFERNVKKAAAMATALPNEIETEVDADISKFRRGLLQAEAMAKRFQSSTIKKRILGDASSFTEAIFGAKKSVIDFDKHYQDAKGRWHDIDTGAFVKEFKEIDSIFTRVKRKFARPIVAKFEVKRDNFNKFVNEVDRMNDNFQNELMRLAKMISAVGTVIGNVIRGGLIASFSALIPIIASLTSVVMMLGNALGVTVGNLLALVGAFGIAGLGAAAYGGLVASVLARYNDEAFEATQASEAFTRALDSIKSVWSGIVDQNIDKVFMTMGQAIYAAQFALEGITPFINQVVDSVRSMTNEFKTFTQESPTMLRFFDNLNNKGVAVFENIARGAGQFGKGLIDMLNAAMPLIEWVAQGFENLGTSFANWADRMAETNGFHDFTNYVMENMPKISSIFSDAFHGIIDLFAAFGENSSHVLDGLVDMMERFREWSATIKESDGFQKFIDYIQTNGPTVVSLIGNIVMMVVNFAVAMAPIAQVVLEVVNAIIAWTAELFKTNPIVAQVIGIITTLAGIFMMLVPTILVVTKVLVPFIGMLVRIFTQSALVKGAIALLGSAFSLLSGPVGIVIGAIGMLVIALVAAYNEIEWFRNIVNTAWTFISTFIQERVQLIIDTFNGFREEGQGIFEALWNTIVTIISEGLAQTWEKITTWISEILAAFLEWGAGLIESIRTTLAEFALTILTKLLEAKAKFSEWITGVIESIIEFGVNLVETIRTALTEFALTIMTKLIEAKERFNTWISETIAAIIQFGADLVSNIVSSLSEFASNIASKLSEAYSNFTSWVSDTISSIVSFGADLVSNIISSMSEFVSGIASGTADAISEFVSFAAEAVSEIISFGADMVSEIISAMADFVSEIISGGANAVSEVATMGSNIVSEIGGFVGDMVSAGADLVSGLIEGIKGMAEDAVSAVTGVVDSAIGAAKRLLGINSPSRVFRSFGEYTMQGLEIGINRMASRAIGAVTDVAKDMTDSFAPDLTTTADIDGQIDNFNRELRNTVDADITSGIETQRPQVNITVRNEGDVEMIRSYIQEEDAIDDSLAF